MSKKIIIGNVREEFYNLPMDMFKMALYLSKKDDFVVRSNNPQFIEALEVLCGEDNVEVFFRGKYPYKLIKISFKEAYDYLGDIYDIINSIRFAQEIINDEDKYYLNEEEIIEDIKKYEEKWSKFE